MKQTLVISLLFFVILSSVVMAQDRMPEKKEFDYKLILKASPQVLKTGEKTIIELEINNSGTKELKMIKVKFAYEPVEIFKVERIIFSQMPIEKVKKKEEKKKEEKKKKQVKLEDKREFLFAKIAAGEKISIYVTAKGILSAAGKWTFTVSSKELTKVKSIFKYVKVYF